MKGRRKLVVHRTDYTKRHYGFLAAVGGFLESYAIINRSGLFGNAQTANFTHLWLSVAQRDLLEVIYYLTPLLLYCFAIFLASYMPLKLKNHMWPKICLILEIISILILGFLPTDVEDKFAILPIFFCTALQYQTFRSCHGYGASSLFVTNNIRQCISSLTYWLVKKDHNELERFEIYLFVIAFFAIGAVCAMLFGLLFGDKSVLLCLIPLVCVFIMLEK